MPWADTTTPNSPYIQGAASAAAIMSGFANGASFNSLLAQLGSGLHDAHLSSTRPEPSTLRITSSGASVSSRHSATRARCRWAMSATTAFTFRSTTQALNALPGMPAQHSVPGCTLASRRGDLRHRRSSISSSAVSNYNGLTASYQPAYDVWLHGAGQLHLEPCDGRSVQRRYRSTPFNNGTRRHGTSSIPLACVATTTATRITTFATPSTPATFGRHPGSSATSSSTAPSAAGPSRRTSSPVRVCLSRCSTATRIGNYRSTATRSILAQVSRLGQGSCNQYGISLPERVNNFTTASR